MPAILEYIPYRKSDFTAVYDSITHPYQAGRGYACVRVDLRGSGDSDGVLEDEYLEGETQTIRALRRGDWQIQTRTRTIVTSTPTHFRIRAELDAHEGASRVYCRSWDTEIPRDLV